MSPLDVPPAPMPTGGTLAELPMLRPCGKLGILATFHRGKSGKNSCTPTWPKDVP